MGSRAILVICRQPEVAVQRFGLSEPAHGVCYTRTGRRFFDDIDLEQAFLMRVGAAAEASGLWQELDSDWICLDAELMPWSAKAQGLLREQYAAVGAAAGAAFEPAIQVLQSALERGVETGSLLERYAARHEDITKYIRAYHNYCWPVDGLDDLKLAPFHLLASEGHVHFDQSHTWHMQTLTRLCAGDEALLMATAHRLVDLSDPQSEARATAWWQSLTEAGGEGMVVKPLDFITHGPRGLSQPAIKCRGREYLRIIYGPEYAQPEHIERLRARNVGRKRGLAVREFALGLEALQRFVRKEPLRRVHECVFGVLALESEPVDPRL
jgi:protein phosphatase